MMRGLPIGTNARQVDLVGYRDNAFDSAVNLESMIQ